MEIRKRLLLFFVAATMILAVLPLRSGAVAPIGLIQSALASYVTSAGYKLYNDQGTGADILGSLGDLYDDYVTLNNKTISGNLATLAYLANSPLIYTDNSGQICINAVAANIMQGFADWIQSNYSVPVGSQAPTEIVQASGGIYSNGDGLNLALLNNNVAISGPVNPQTGISTVYYDPSQIFAHDSSYDYYFGTVHPNTVYITTLSSNLKPYFFLNSSENGYCVFRIDIDGRYILKKTYFNVSLSTQTWYDLNISPLESDAPLSTVSDIYSADMSDLSSSGGVAGLAVSLAQTVADVVGQAADDDAVVIGVGAGVGATAQDIADAVASGVKAQTLDPSVSIVAESVIDTPVQVYPDIDGLGLPELGAALTSRFPFCIPWDFVDTVKLLNAQPAAPNIHIDLFPAAFKSKVGISRDTSFDFDLSTQQYSKIGVFCRWGSLLSFCFLLVLLTKRIIWTS